MNVTFLFIRAFGILKPKCLYGHFWLQWQNIWVKIVTTIKFTMDPVRSGHVRSVSKDSEQFGILKPKCLVSLDYVEDPLTAIQRILKLKLIAMILFQASVICVIYVTNLCWTDQINMYWDCAKEWFFFCQVFCSLPGGALLLPVFHCVELSWIIEVQIFLLHPLFWLLQDGGDALAQLFRREI